ncbi:hypothetical protein ABFS83_12G017000 [Erythranthe nasuta]
MKSLFSTLLLVSLLLMIAPSFFLVDAAEAEAAAPAVTPSSNCNAMCNKRCEKAGIFKRCFNYCCVCCSKCNCVPSGTYGNKSECPCYRDMVNSKGKSKCP